MGIKRKKKHVWRERNMGGTNIHHRCPKAQGGRDNWPQNNLVKVSVYRHGLWNTIFNGRERIASIVKKINLILEACGRQVRVEEVNQE